MIPNEKQILAEILSEMRVALGDEFDLNFQRKGFFNRPWKPRSPNYHNTGTLLAVRGILRRSILGGVSTTDHGVRFSSSVPYAEAHNEGLTGFKPVRAHKRNIKKTGKAVQVRAHTRKFNLAQRQFIGDGPETQRIIRECIEKVLNKYHLALSEFLRQ